MTFSELKQKVLFRVGVSYLAGLWLILQIVATLTRYYGMSTILFKGFAFMLIGGYPIVMGMAWVYELTHKTRGWKEQNLAEGKEAEPGKGFYIIIGGIVGLAVAILITDLIVLG